MFDDIDSNFMPTFDVPTIKRDVVRVACKCSGSANWLESRASHIAAKVQLPLIVCKFSQVPWPKKFMAFFPYTKESDGRLLLMLNRCNQAVPDIVWEVVRRKEGDNGVHLLVKADDSTAKILRQHHDGLHFGAGKALIREFIPKRRKAKTTGQAPSALDDAGDNTSAAEDAMTELANMSLEVDEETGISKHSEANASLGVSNPVESSSSNADPLNNSITILPGELSTGTLVAAAGTNQQQVLPGGPNTVTEPSQKMDQ